MTLNDSQTNIKELKAEEVCASPANELLSVLNTAAFKQGLHVNLFIERTKHDSLLSDLEDLQEQIEAIESKMKIKRNKLDKILSKIALLNDQIMNC